MVAGLLRPAQPGVPEVVEQPELVAAQPHQEPGAGDHAVDRQLRRRDAQRGGAGVPGEYRVLFCEALQFDAGATSLVFARSYLQLPVVQTATSLREFLRGAPANFLVKYRDPKSLAARIRRRLRERAVGEWPAFEQFCAELNLSEATLRRRLRIPVHVTRHRQRILPHVSHKLRLSRFIPAVQFSAPTLADTRPRPPSRPTTARS